MESQRTQVGIFGVTCIDILPYISSSSRDDVYYSESMERHIHLDSKGTGAGHGGGIIVVPTSSAGDVSEKISRASMADDGIGSRA